MHYDPDVLDRLNELGNAYPEAHEVFSDAIGGIVAGILQKLELRARYEAQGDDWEATKIFLELFDNDPEVQKYLPQPFLHLAVVNELKRMEEAREEPPESLLYPSPGMAGLMVMFQCLVDACESGWL